MSRPLALTLGFALCACANNASSPPDDPTPVTAPHGASQAKPVEKSAVPAMVIERSQAEHRMAPGGAGQVAMLLQGENAFVAHLELPPLTEIPPHRDETEEYLVVLDGGGTLMIDGRSYQLRTGSAVLMPANAEVSYANGPQTLVAIQVFAGPAPAKKYDSWTVVSPDEATNK